MSDDHCDKRYKTYDLDKKEYEAHCRHSIGLLQANVHQGLHYSRNQNGDA
jgi:hypothetical protein